MKKQVIALLLGGALLCALYETGNVLPVWASMSVFTAAIGGCIWKVHASPVSYLPRLVMALVAMPFIHCYPYIWFDYTPTREMWDMTSNPYQFDPEIMSRVAMVGCIGVVALLAGMLSYRGRGRVVERDDERVLKSSSFFFLLLGALAFSWLQAPQETIFVAKYTSSASALDSSGVTFNSAYLIAYGFIIACMLDCRHDPDSHRRWFKVRGLTATVLIIVVYFQFLRGNRECIGLLFALAGVYLLDTRVATGSRDVAKELRRKLFLIGTCGAITFLAAQLTGIIRSQSEERSITQVLDATDVPLKRLFSGTWSGALLSVLSVVGDFYNDRMHARHGQTYIDYLLSLPPGIVAQFFGFERPIEATRSPAWEMRYGIGGTHAVVVPFMNFLTWGVLGVLFLYGRGVAWLEHLTGSSPSRRILLLYGCILIICPFWLWYGEMALVRGIMAFFCIWPLYLVLAEKPDHAATPKPTWMSADPDPDTHPRFGHPT